MRSVKQHDAAKTLEQPAVQEASYIEKALGLALLLILVAGCVLVLMPFLKSLFLAATLCISTWPLFRRAGRLMGGRQSLAALLMIFIAASLLVVPLVLLVANLADDVARLAAALYSALDRGLPPPVWLKGIPLVGGEAERLWHELSQQGTKLGPTLAPYIRPMREWLVNSGAVLLSGTAQVALSIIIAFFFYQDGAHVEKRLEWALSRLGGWRARHVLRVAGRTITAVVNGVLGTALVQGALLGLSFWVAGVPGAIVLGAIGVVLSLVPMGLVVLWLPAGLWLMSQEHTGWAVFVMAWNGLLVGSLDNVLRPYLIGRGIRLPAALIFLGVLGGILTFGIVGVFLGPVLLAVAFTLFQDWGRAGEVPPDTT